MAYAAYQDHGVVSVRCVTVFQVLHITVASVNCCRVRRALATIDGVGVLRCEPLLHSNAASASAAPRACLVVRLPNSSYAEVVHVVLGCVPDGQIGLLSSWRSHLQKRGIRYGG